MARNPLLRRFLLRLKLLWELARTERSTPRDTAWAAAIGLFMGCTPLVGLRTWIALGVATLAKKNRLFTYLCAHVSGNWIVSPWVMFAEVQLAHRLRTGGWLPIEVARVVKEGSGLLLDWCLGAVPVGLAVALVGGVLAYRMAKRRKLAPAAAPEAVAEPAS